MLAGLSMCSTSKIAYEILGHNGPQLEIFWLQKAYGENSQVPIERPQKPQNACQGEGMGMRGLVIGFWGFTVPITPKWVPHDLPKKIRT